MYKKTSHIATGSYGVVSKAVTEDGQVVAIKKYKSGVDGTTLREIGVLKRLKHKNIVELLDVKTDRKKVYTVYKYYKYNLKDLIMTVKQTGKTFSTKHLRGIMIDLLRGLHYCHSGGIMHRDIKPENILVGSCMKLCDFGMARKTYSQKYTPEVVTLWYRAPEILLGDDNYGEKIDIWSVGCILMELVMLQPCFQGDCQIGQLYKIFEVLGTPDDGYLKTLKYYREFPKWSNQLHKLVSPEVLNFAQGLLHYNPKTRFSALEALQHEFLNDKKIPKTLDIETDNPDMEALEIVNRFHFVPSYMDEVLLSCIQIYNLYKKTKGELVNKKDIVVVCLYMADKIVSVQSRGIKYYEAYTKEGIEKRELKILKKVGWNVMPIYGGELEKYKKNIIK